MTEFEVTCKVERGERNIAYGDDCYCYYTQPNYTECIVRCRDCKHSDGAYCNRLGYAVFLAKPDGFCAWGVRRDD